MSKTALTNLRVFDGRDIGKPTMIVIDGDRIGTDAAGAQTIDAAGAILLPGLIDAHIHLTGAVDMERLRDHGVTTGLVMGSWPPGLVASLLGKPGLTDLRTAGPPAVGAGGNHAKMPAFPKESIVTEPGQARLFVAARVSEGADYIKVITEAPGRGGLDQPTLNALVEEAHRHGKLVVAHAVAAGAYDMALESGVDVLTHAPLDKALDDVAVQRLTRENRIVVPTLTMMEGIVAQAGRAGPSYRQARASVAAMYRAGVPVLAGTDANSVPGAPASVPHGSSLHRELELLVDAGLTTVDALRAATSRPAKYFGLDDRGAIAPGLRADLVLIDGDPLADITATRRIQRVWCAGIEHIPA
jgi:imidazolonepropionase-like amidohydrolase